MLMLKENIEAYEISLGFLRTILKKSTLHELIVENPHIRDEYAAVWKKQHQIFDMYYKDYQEPEVIMTE